MQDTRGLRLLGAIVVMLACTSLGARALAQPSQQQRDAAAQFVFLGDDLRQQGDHAGALKAYQQADSIMGVPTTGIEVGRELLALGRLVEAQEKLRKVAKQPHSPGEPEVYEGARREAHRLVAELEARIPTIEVHLEGIDDPASATVVIDGKPVEPGHLRRPLKQDPGVHIVEAAASGLPHVHKDIELREGERQVVVLTFGGDAQAAPPTRPGGEPPASQPPRADTKNLITLGAQLDFFFVAGVQDVCGVAPNAGGSADQELANIHCYNSGGEYLGKPAEGKFNEMEGGVVLPPSVRLLAGYDRVVWKGLTLGGRIGYAFGGLPDVGDAEDRYDDCDNNSSACRKPEAPEPLPLHVELRASYLFLRGGIARPFAFVAGGIAQIAGGATVAVCDYVDEDGYTPINAPTGDGRCPAGTKKRDDIDAYQIAGDGFIGGGAGVVVALHRHFGLVAEMKVMIMVPNAGFTLAPFVGPVALF